MKNLIFILISVLFISSCSAPGNHQKNTPDRENPYVVSTAGYLACGCGCCGGTDPDKQSLYHSKGDDLNKIIQEDKKLQQREECKYAGCSKGVLYEYCD